MCDQEGPHRSDSAILLLFLLHIGDPLLDSDNILWSNTSGGVSSVDKSIELRGEGNSGRVQSISGRDCGVDYIIRSQLDYRSYHLFVSRSVDLLDFSEAFQFVQRNLISI
jgi:hypothetical protein